MHDRLIEVAWRLVEGSTADASEASLRRAVSTAYYAVFHAICRLCATELVGGDSLRDEWSAIYRSVDHGAFRATRDADGRERRLGDRVRRLLELTIDLQRDRHVADYNPGPFDYGETDVRALLNSAAAAVDALETLSASERKILAVALIARPRRRQQ